MSDKIDIVKMSEETGMPLDHISDVLGIPIPENPPNGLTENLGSPTLDLEQAYELYDFARWGNKQQDKVKIKRKINELHLGQLADPSLTREQILAIYGETFSNSTASVEAIKKMAQFFVSEEQ
ncbi:MAG: hypothetical protein WC246_00895 [Candidatus Paceibacterota bacterium]|jgi:hypothetical protein